MDGGFGCLGLGFLKKGVEKGGFILLLISLLVPIRRSIHSTEFIVSSGVESHAALILQLSEYTHQKHDGNRYRNERGPFDADVAAARLIIPLKLYEDF